LSPCHVVLTASFLREIATRTAKLEFESNIKFLISRAVTASLLGAAAQPQKCDVSFAYKGGQTDEVTTVLRIKTTQT
jgi:hypothetical protein